VKRGFTRVEPAASRLSNTARSPTQINGWTALYREPLSEAIFGLAKSGIQEAFMKTVTNDHAKASRIRALNDALRTTCVGGAVVCTSGFAALPEAIRQRFMFAMRDFSKFTADNDPDGENFG
jgi:hypothetical protein